MALEFSYKYKWNGSCYGWLQKKNQERFAVFREKHKKGRNFKEKKGELRGVIKYNRVFLHEYVRLVLNINLIPDTQQISL